MGSPRLALRFSNPRPDINTVAEHDAIYRAHKQVLWGWWGKEFENFHETRSVAEHLKSHCPQDIYIIDTTDKASPRFHVVRVADIIVAPETVERELVPSYYHRFIEEIPIWLLLESPLLPSPADPQVLAILGTPTFYPLDYEKDGSLRSGVAPKEYRRANPLVGDIILHLSDVHLGEDHNFLHVHEPMPVGPRKLTVSECIRRDLEREGVVGRIGMVIVSGDFVTKGGWKRQYHFEEKTFTGFELAAETVTEISKVVQVPLEHFVFVPGNHDILRRGDGSNGSPKEIRPFIHYDHETDFRTFREEMTGVYKLSPLNYCTWFKGKGGDVVIGALNTAYICSSTRFAEYGYVGTELDQVLASFGGKGGQNAAKVVVMHHHVLPIASVETPKENGISLTLDAAYVLTKVQEAGVKLILHGHQHIPKVMRYSSLYRVGDHMSGLDGHDVCVVASGSTGASRIEAGEANTYSLISFEPDSWRLTIKRLRPDGEDGGAWCRGVPVSPV